MIDEFRALANLPPPPSLNPKAGAPEGQCRCACAKKLIALNEITYHQTGLVTASDILCHDCFLQIPTFVLLVCIQCKAVIARMPPAKFPGGFEFKARHCYHVAMCANCCPGLEKSICLEKYQYDKAQGRPVPDIKEVLPK